MHIFTQFHAKTTKIRLPYLIILGLLFFSIQNSPADELAFSEARNFHQLVQQLQQEKKPLLLVFELPGCRYCAALEQQQLRPLLKDLRYQNRLILRTFDTQSAQEVIDFDGKKIDSADFVARYEGQLTPTLTFLDAKGEQLSEKLIGYERDFYSAFLEDALQESLRNIQR